MSAERRAKQPVLAPKHERSAAAPDVIRSKPELPGVAPIVHRGLEGLPAHPTARSLNQTALLQIQKTHSNGHLQRLLLLPPTIQRSGGEVHRGCPCADRASGDEADDAPIQRAAADAPPLPAPPAAVAGGAASAGPDVSGLQAGRVAAEQLPADPAAAAPERLSTEATTMVGRSDDVAAKIGATVPAAGAVATKSTLPETEKLPSVESAQPGAKGAPKPGPGVAAEAKQRAGSVGKEAGTEAAAIAAERPPIDTAAFLAIMETVPGVDPSALGGRAQPPATGATGDGTAVKFDAGCQNAPQAYVAPPVDTAATKRAKLAELDVEYQRQTTEAKATAAGQLQQGQQIAAQKKAAAHQEKQASETAARALAAQDQQAAQAESAQKQAAANAQAAAQQSQAQQSAASQQKAFQGDAQAKIADLRTRGQQQIQQITQKVRSGTQELTSRAEQAARDVIEKGRQAAEAARREAERMRQGASSLLDRALNAVRSGINRLVNAARNLWDRAVAAGRQLVEKARAAVGKLVEWGRQKLQEAAKWLKEKLAAAWQWLKDKLAALARWLKEKLLAILNWIKKTIIAILKFLHKKLAEIVLRLLLGLTKIGELLLKGLIAITGWLGKWGKGIQKWLMDKLKDLQEFRARMKTILDDASTGDLYGCDDVQKAKITRCSALAVTLGNGALAKLSNPASLDPATSTQFKTYFKSDAQEHVIRARSVLGAAVGGISGAPTNMKCEPAGSTQCGGVHAYTFWAILVPFVSMHFCADFLTRGDREVALVILHEATHKFGRTDDHAYGSAALGLSTDQALSNADSYEQFVGAVA